MAVHLGLLYVGVDRKAKRELTRMVDLEILSKVGARRNRRYMIGLQ